jgi:dynein heavy chain, axonemal
METSVTQMKKTISARKNYEPLANIAAKLFFVINDFSLINNMYQFSLDSYINLFQRVITTHHNKTSVVNDSLQDKLKSISANHQEEVFKFACRGLFEQDKLLLSIMMAVKLSKDIEYEEWSFFLRGSDNLYDRKQQPPNPNPDWIN